MRLFSRHERRIKGYILALVPHWQDAEDLIAETNMRLWEQFHEFDPSKDFGAWACTIAHYMVLAYRKKASRDRLRLSDAFINAVAPQAAEYAPEEPRRSRALHECLGQLGESSRRLLRLVYGGERTTKQIAEELGRSLSATYMSLSRIRHALYKCIQEKLNQEGAA